MSGPNMQIRTKDDMENSESSNSSPYQALFNSIPQSGLKSDILFLAVKNRIPEEPEYVEKLRVVFRFNITKNNELAAVWTCDTRTSIEGDIYRAVPKVGLKVDCTITVGDDDLIEIMVGKLNPQRAFMMSKFKIRGNIMLLQKLYVIWFELRKKGKTPELDLIQEIMLNEPLIPGLKSEVMAIEMVQRIVKAPHLAERINAIIQLNILKQSRIITQYLLAMHPGKKPQFSRLFNAQLHVDEQKEVKNRDSKASNVKKADVVFTMEDDDLVLVVYGIKKVRELINLSRISVEGSKDLVDRAIVLFEQPPIMAKL